MRLVFAVRGQETCDDCDRRPARVVRQSAVRAASCHREFAGIFENLSGIITNFLLNGDYKNAVFYTIQDDNDRFVAEYV